LKRLQGFLSPLLNFNLSNTSPQLLLPPSHPFSASSLAERYGPFTPQRPEWSFWTYRVTLPYRRYIVKLISQAYLDTVVFPDENRSTGYKDELFIGAELAVQRLFEGLKTNFKSSYYDEIIRPNLLQKLRHEGNLLTEKGITIQASSPSLPDWANRFEVDDIFITFGPSVDVSSAKLIHRISVTEAIYSLPRSNILYRNITNQFVYPNSAVSDPHDPPSDEVKRNSQERGCKISVHLKVQGIRLTTTHESKSLAMVMPGGWSLILDMDWFPGKKTENPNWWIADVFYALTNEEIQRERADEGYIIEK